MKVGFVLECGPDGADKQVCEYLAKQICADIEPESRTLDNKPRLIQDCGLVAAKLLQDGCKRVLIVWDLQPAWPGSKPCRKSEREAIMSKLHEAGLVEKPIFLICIEQELESWLLADETKISAFLSTAEHSYTAQRVKKPDRVPDPKARMVNHFKTARGWRYEDRTHAIRVLKSADTNLKKLRRSTTFARFERMVSAVLP